MWSVRVNWWRLQCRWRRLHTHTHAHGDSDETQRLAARALLSLSKRGELKRTTTTTTKASTGAGTSELYKSKTDPQGGCFTHTHTRTQTRRDAHTNRHDAHATSLTRETRRNEKWLHRRSKTNERESGRGSGWKQNALSAVALRYVHNSSRCKYNWKQCTKFKCDDARLRYASAVKAECTRRRSARTRARTRTLVSRVVRSETKRRHNFVSIRRALTLLLSLSRSRSPACVARPRVGWVRVCVRESGAAQPKQNFLHNLRAAFFAATEFRFLVFRRRKFQYDNNTHVHWRKRTCHVYVCLQNFHTHTHRGYIIFFSLHFAAQAKWNFLIRNVHTHIDDTALFRYVILYFLTTQIKTNTIYS